MQSRSEGMMTAERARLDLQVARREGDIGVREFYRVDALLGGLLPEEDPEAD